MAKNTADKRSVHTDALETLGPLIGDNEKRDAIHLAVEPAVAAVTLHPGQPVGFVEGGFGPSKKPLGIVDPFLKGSVYPGQRFWLILMPRQITSLRHVWSHPAFDDEGESGSEKEKAIAYSAMTRIANDLGVEIEDLIDHATMYLESDYHYWSEGGRFEGVYLPDEFWDHFEDYRGETIPSEKRGSFFSCAC